MRQRLGRESATPKRSGLYQSQGGPQRISRYENGRITPSLDAIVRIAEALNVSIDHLLVDNVPRRPLHSVENALGDRLAVIAELDDDELATLNNVIDGLVARTRLRTLTGGIS